MNTRITWSVLAFLLVIAGCNSGSGPDSLFNRSAPAPHARVSDCLRCHNSANSPTLDPLVSNGSGTFGKHIKHVQERGIDCDRCHHDYMNAPTHMNGVFDRGNPSANLVNMNIVGPAGRWAYDPGSGTGSCSGVACHGSATLDWYGTNTWTLPTCTTCHASGFSADLDPLVTNGAPPAGRHEKHVTVRAIDCERCHYNYPGSTTHANGVLDTGNPDVSLVRFNIIGPAASWSNDTGAGSGQCASVSCHASNALGWYGTETWTLPADCTTCHSSSYLNALDPLATNGSGTAGKHVNHVTNSGMACSRCHENYPAKTSHANGSMDTQDPAVLLVLFDALNSSGTWTNDTGQETGNCSSLLCHGTDNPAWYGLAGVSFTGCAACHSGSIGSRRQIFGAAGDFGKNANNKSHHVSGGADPTSTQCLVCHDLSKHMSGTVRVKNADNGAAIAYDPASPSTLEPFCLSCHDSNGALSTFATGGTPTSPFIDGAVMGQAPNRASVEILANWNKAFGHRQQGLTCIGNGTPNTGCHANGHGSLHLGLLSRNLTLPLTKTNLFVAADEPDYDLCFTCHASSPKVTKEAILGAKQGGNYDLAQASPYFIPSIQTSFRDHNLDGASGNIYDDPVTFGGAFVNLHLLHVQGGPNLWAYRDTVPSAMHCLGCHSIHGSNTPFGWVHDEMLFGHFTGTGTDAYGMMEAPLNVVNYPISCSRAFNCHASFIDFFGGNMHSWFEPSGE
jgi:predicted CxxxxCH...CXXCH cytochrome family protein